MANRKESYKKYNDKRKLILEDSGKVKIQTTVKKETKEYLESIQTKINAKSIGEIIDNCKYSPRGETKNRKI